MPSLQVVYEDNHLLVVVKPANILSQGDDTGDISMVNIAKRYLKDKYQKQGNIYLGLIHRLDRPVAGLMLLAKTSKAATRLSEALSKKEIRRSYLAIAEGAMQSMRMEHFLLQDAQGFVGAATKNVKGAQIAILNASVLAQKEHTSLCYVELATGRKHQIRAQFKLSGHPLQYDMRYGKGKVGKQIALYGAVLELTHPTTKERLRFVSNPVTDGKIDSFSLYSNEIEEFLKTVGEQNERSIGENII